MSRRFFAIIFPENADGACPDAIGGVRNESHPRTPDLHAT